MKRLDTAATLVLTLGLLALTGCEDAPLRIDPLNTNGRDGGGKPLNYPTLMRIGAAAHAGGDLATAVGLYRRAAAIDPHNAAPFVAAGNTLMEMGNSQRGDRCLQLGAGAKWPRPGGAARSGALLI